MRCRSRALVSSALGTKRPGRAATQRRGIRRGSRPKGFPLSARAILSRSPSKASEFLVAHALHRPSFVRPGKGVGETLPDSRVVVMPGHGRAAMDTGTDLFTTEVPRFLASR